MPPPCTVDGGGGVGGDRLKVLKRKEREETERTHKRGGEAGSG